MVKTCHHLQVIQPRLVFTRECSNNLLQVLIYKKIALFLVKIFCKNSNLGTFFQPRFAPVGRFEWPVGTFLVFFITSESVVVCAMQWYA